MPFFGGGDSSSGDDEYTDPKAGRRVPLNKKKKQQQQNDDDQKKQTVSSSSIPIIPVVVVVGPPPANVLPPPSAPPAIVAAAVPPTAAVVNDDEFGFSKMLETAQHKKTSDIQARWGGGGNTNKAAVSTGSQLLSAMSEAAKTRAEDRTIRQIQQSKKERQDEAEKDDDLMSRDLEVGTFVTKRYQLKIQELQKKHGKSLFEQQAEKKENQKGSKSSRLGNDEDEEEDYYNTLNTVGPPKNGTSSAGASGPVAPVPPSVALLLSDLIDDEDEESEDDVIPSPPPAVAEAVEGDGTPPGRPDEVKNNNNVGSEASVVEDLEATHQHLGDELKEREAQLNAAKAERRRARMFQTLPDSYIQTQLRQYKKVQRDREAAMVNYLVTL